MRLRRVWALFVARNREFYRDRASLAWNLVFPLIMVGGLGFIFSDRGQPLATYALVAGPAAIEPESFGALRSLEHVRLVEVPDQQQALELLRRQKVDLVVAAPGTDAAGRYWVDSATPRGYLAERLLLGATARPDPSAARVPMQVEALSYTRWMFPGLLALNLMWMSLYGVGWSIVRYRHNGVLKRYHATPLTALEYLSAQVLSRLVLMAFTATFVLVGCYFIYGIGSSGSLALLALTLLLGTTSATGIGLVVASRSESPELVSAVLNFIAPAMMLLGGVWFSLEGSPGWVRAIASALPLTRCVDATRAIMNEGAGFAEVSGYLSFLVIFSLVGLVGGAALFRWHHVD